MRLKSIIASACLALTACTPADEEAADDGTALAEPSAAASATPAPDAFAGTAWRALAEDGARYTTYIDADGTYRDLRNGDPWQVGYWTYRDAPQGGSLCFTPEAENAVERCWKPGRMTGEALQATGPDGRRIELERVDYLPPQEEESGKDDDAA